jgi:hypothetical protein
MNPTRIKVSRSLNRANRLRSFVVLSLFFFLNSKLAAEGEFPRGFFLEDLRHSPPVPAFYNLETHRLEPFQFQTAYHDFIDIYWDQVHGRIFFSARLSASDPYRVYLKEWPQGDEKPIYENPLGPFRFLMSPDGQRLVLQVMGPAAWPILGVYTWQTQKWTLLGQGHSPDWSTDSQRLLFLKIPGSLPSWLYEFDVDTDTATLLIHEPVMEAAYTDDPHQIVLKTASQSKQCDIFQLWNSRTDRFHPFCLEDPGLCKKKAISQRDLGAFPGHRFFFFKESVGSHEPENQNVIVTDVWGGRLQTIPNEDWDPQVSAIEETSLAISEDPLYLVSADGAGRKVEIPQARFIRIHR